jgi:pimeloyl-ACP methyl ester carboxylesterase
VIGDYYTAAHQPGAKWAPSAFVSGDLNCAIERALEAIPNPIGLAWGREARVTPPSQADQFRAIRPNARLEVFDGAGLLPHVERPAAFVRLAQRVLNES